MQLEKNSWSNKLQANTMVDAIIDTKYFKNKNLTELPLNVHLDYSVAYGWRLIQITESFDGSEPDKIVVLASSQNPSIGMKVTISGMVVCDNLT